MVAKKTPPMRGWIFLGLWFVLILIGIIEKRVFGHADRMIFYHLPAAVCLVLACYELSTNVRRRYREALLRYQS